MLWRDLITLVAIGKTVDADGYKVETVTRREVYADTKSARRSEFYAAKQTGVEITFVCTVRAVDYNGERWIECYMSGEPVVYRVVRTYSTGGDNIELNCTIEPAPASVGRRAR